MIGKASRLAAVVVVAGALGAAGLSTAASASTGPGNAAAAKAALSGVYAGTIHGSGVAGTASRRVTSTNWSGYADSGMSFRKSISTWTEPAIACPTRQLQIAVFWVGIDGFSSGTVEQDGTLAECYLGSAFYFTWWEMFPTNDIQAVGSTVRPGDKITASVVRTGTKYALKVTDSTTRGNSFSVTQRCASSVCANSSDEVIGEAPSGERGEFPLPHFTPWTPGSIVFATTTSTGDVSTFRPTYQITMVGDAGYALASPSALKSGNKFTDTWRNSYGPRG